jgi:hypothetical protein
MKSAAKPNEAVVLTQTSNTISNKKRRATEIIQNEVCYFFKNRLPEITLYLPRYLCLNV